MQVLGLNSGAEAVTLLETLHGKGFLRRNTPTHTYGMPPLLRAVLLREARTGQHAVFTNAVACLVGHGLQVAAEAAGLEASNAEVSPTYYAASLGVLFSFYNRGLLGHSLSCDMW